MRYTPHTDADKEQMLRALGLSQIEEIFDHIPKSLRERAGISLPPGLPEERVKKKMASLAARNVTPQDWGFFLGGGIYHHF
ncbi:MAG: glycine dehydrogenase, partial [Candidatus Binatia bacterium]